MNYIFDNDRPIYVQLVEKLKLDIVSGKLKAGTRIPSVRDLALQIKVNPNTMQKALVELENEKLLYTERTNGKFVTNDEQLIKNIKNSLAKSTIEKYISDKERLGISYKESIEYLQGIERGN